MVEMLVAVVILGVLSSIAGVSLVNGFEKARQRSTMADMRSIAAAIGSYSVDFDGPPAGGTIRELSNCMVPTFISVVPPNDHWGHPYAYSGDGVSSYTLESFGRDGVSGDDVSQSTGFDFDLDIVLVNGQFVAAPE